MKAAGSRLRSDQTIRLTDNEQSALGLVVAPATEGGLPDTATRYGVVRPQLGDEAVVASPVSGRIIEPPRLTLGQSVAKGEILLVVATVLAAADRVSIEMQGEQRKGEIEAAEKEVALREIDADRARKLAREGIVSTSMLQEAETAEAASRARLEGLRRARSVQSREGEGAVVALRAPVAGRLVVLEASVGAVVNTGDVLARIVRAGPRWVDVAVAPEDPAGGQYEVASALGWVPARLLARGGMVGSGGTREDRLEIEARHAGDLIPGATVAVHAARSSGRGVVLPEAALVPGVQSDIVYVESAPGTFAPRAVRVAARFGGRVRLSEGVRPGELVVVRGAMGLRGENLLGSLGAQD